MDGSLLVRPVRPLAFSLAEADFCFHDVIFYLYLYDSVTAFMNMNGRRPQFGYYQIPRDIAR